MATKEQKEEKEVLEQEAAAEREYQRTRDKEAKMEPEPAPTPQALTVPESGAELREYIHRLQLRLAKGSKSDIDKIVPVLGVILGWLDAHLANQVPDPPVMGDPLDATY